ncbi:phosphomevalonate kinase, partial [Coemansia sp. RSA 1285]
MSCATDAAKSAITLVSAPGKVLVVGGYLVLDRNYSGLVVGTDASLYAAIQEQELEPPSADNAANIDGIPILVVSPQFTAAWWKYVFDTKTNKLVQVDSTDGSKNGFVEVVLEVSLGIRETLANAGLDLDSNSLRLLPRMCETGKMLKDVHKTGLGSSASMVTSLVASVLVHFGVIASHALRPCRDSDPQGMESLQLIHNVAQFAHCLAQGKVGSGFDVSAAVYGSHVYYRFSPSVINDAMGESRTIAEISKAVSPENPGWNSVVRPVDIPPGFILKLADVDAGSNTPSM